MYRKEYNKAVGTDCTDMFEAEYERKEQQKRVIIQALSATELEEMLWTSTKNVAYEVVSCLIEGSFRGVLTDIIRWLKSS